MLLYQNEILQNEKVSDFTKILIYLFFRNSIKLVQFTIYKHWKICNIDCDKHNRLWSPRKRQSSRCVRRKELSRAPLDFSDSIYRFLGHVPFQSLPSRQLFRGESEIRGLNTTKGEKLGNRGQNEKFTDWHWTESWEERCSERKEIGLNRERNVARARGRKRRKEKRSAHCHPLGWTRRMRAIAYPWRTVFPHAHAAIFPYPPHPLLTPRTFTLNFVSIPPLVLPFFSPFFPSLDLSPLFVLQKWNLCIFLGLSGIP